MTTIASKRRSPAEWAFLAVFYPAVFAFYVIYKYPHWILPAGADPRTFYLLGKSPGFWYASLYTALVAGTCLWVLAANRNRYQRSKKKEPLSPYQRGKFTSILLAQSIGFYLVPYVLPALLQPGGFFDDPAKPASKAAHVYVWPAFQSAGTAVYVFLVIPVAVWFFGKRYCSWFCSCGNLAEAVGVLPWGARWVRLHTPRGEFARRWEVIQVYVLAFSVFFGVMLLFDGLSLFSAPTLLGALHSTQDLLIDFAFGSVVGIGAYPILGTRIWCRYGCPLAQGMKLFGKFSRSRFAVVPNDKCRGLGLCTQACPMGIDVAGFAHRDKKPIEISFGLDATPCIGCGGCIDACPVDALSFAPIGRSGLAIVAGHSQNGSRPQ
ncbi:MAG TPA: 4Fe-4S binding protein [Pirellulales bacterium]|nr:4Fe-4S binding protein [Pirellulales bacterium]